MSTLIAHNHNNDGIDRRGFLQCMAWAGAGIVWTIEAGIPTSRAFGQSTPSTESLTFVQISDSHIGFNKPANPDVTGTLQSAIDKINGLESKPSFILHTGDLTHGATAAEFDTLAQLMQSARRDVHYVPGEHDTSADDGKAYMERYGRNTKGQGWYSFDQQGVHFIGLSNVMALEGLGKIGAAQLAWLKEDLNARSASMPVVVFAHIPLWSVYPAVGMGHRRRRGGALIPEALRLSHGTQWPHSPGDAEGGRQRHLPHRHVHGLSAARPGRRARTGTPESAR